MKHIATSLQSSFYSGGEVLTVEREAQIGTKSQGFEDVLGDDSVCPIMKVVFGKIGIDDEDFGHIVQYLKLCAQFNAIDWTR